MPVFHYLPRHRLAAAPREWFKSGRTDW